jgi:hypothetical protein
MASGSCLSNLKTDNFNGSRVYAANAAIKFGMVQKGPVLGSKMRDEAYLSWITILNATFYTSNNHHLTSN